MQEFKVGRCVREELVGRATPCRSWVVIGSSEKDLLSSGFELDVADSSVFLHPRTQERYVLAKTYAGAGVFKFGPEVSLEEDLSCRGFTIDAMSKSKCGVLLDFFGGHRDMELGVVRMLSGSSLEVEPILVFRAASLAAELDFSIDDETFWKMKQVVGKDAFSNIAKNKICAELKYGLKGKKPSRMWEYLRGCGALDGLAGSGLKEMPSCL